MDTVTRWWRDSRSPPAGHPGDAGCHTAGHPPAFGPAPAGRTFSRWWATGLAGRRAAKTDERERAAIEGELQRQDVGHATRAWVDDELGSPIDPAGRQRRTGSTCMDSAQAAYTCAKMLLDARI